MSVELKDIVKPSDFALKARFVDSPLGDSEKETVARNIVIISFVDDDTWKEFTFEDYKRKCKRTNFNGEEGILNEFATKHRILDKDGDVYAVNERFFRVLAQFIQ